MSPGALSGELAPYSFLVLSFWHVPGQATVPLLVATSPLNQESECLLQRVLVRSHQGKHVKMLPNSTWMAVNLVDSCLLGTCPVPAKCVIPGVGFIKGQNRSPQIPAFLELIF